MKKRTFILFVASVLTLYLLLCVPAFSVTATAFDVEEPTMTSEHSWVYVSEQEQAEHGKYTKMNPSEAPSSLVGSGVYSSNVSDKTAENNTIVNIKEYIAEIFVGQTESEETAETYTSIEIGPYEEPISPWPYGLPPSYGDDSNEDMAASCRSAVEYPVFAVMTTACLLLRKRRHNT